MTDAKRAKNDEMLAVFIDRHTMRHTRWYPHEIELVWETVTTGDHLDVWMLPVSKVERRLGGACSFSWGGPEERSVAGTVTVWEPPNAVQYSFDGSRSSIRFDLESEGDGTRLHFTQCFGPGEGTTPADPDDPGADLPAGPDTPWRPGFVAGFHEFLDDLTDYLRGDFTAEDRSRHLGAGNPAINERHDHLISVYRSHIAEHCPPV